MLLVQLGVGVKVCLVEGPLYPFSFGLSSGVLFCCSGGDLVPRMSGRTELVVIVHRLVDQGGVCAVLAFVAQNGVCSVFVVGLEVWVSSQ